MACGITRKLVVGPQREAAVTRGMKPIEFGAEGGGVARDQSQLKHESQ
jgi:hypothetical protein